MTMLNIFKCNPYFDFDSNELKTHAFNIKLISAWFFDHGWPLGNCMELLAQGCGFQSYAAASKTFKDHFNEQGIISPQFSYEPTQQACVYNDRLTQSSSYKLLIQSHTPYRVDQFIAMVAMYMNEVGINLNENFGESSFKGTFLFGQLGELRRLIPIIAKSQSFLDFAISNTLMVQNPDLASSAEVLLSIPEIKYFMLQLEVPQNDQPNIQTAIPLLSSYVGSDFNDGQRRTVANIGTNFKFQNYEVEINKQLLVMLDFQIDEAKPIHDFFNLDLNVKNLELVQPVKIHNSSTYHGQGTELSSAMHSLFESTFHKENILKASVQLGEDLQDFLSRIPAEYEITNGEKAVRFRAGVKISYQHSVPEHSNASIELIFEASMKVSIFVNKNGRTEANVKYAPFNDQVHFCIAQYKSSGLESFSAETFKGLLLLQAESAKNYIYLAQDQIESKINRNSFELEYIRKLLINRTGQGHSIDALKDKILSNTAKPEFKIQLNNHNQYLRAWGLLEKMGYYCDATPYTAQYLYCYSDGHIGVDYFDVEGVDTSKPESAYGHYTNHKNPEISLDDLVDLAAYHEIWTKAPADAYHWERLPNGKCVWHCRSAENALTTDKKAPNFNCSRNTSWRDPKKQNEADRINSGVNSRLADLGIKLAYE